MFKNSNNYWVSREEGSQTSYQDSLTNKEKVERQKAQVKEHCAKKNSIKSKKIWFRRATSDTEWKSPEMLKKGFFGLVKNSF